MASALPAERFRSSAIQHALERSGDVECLFCGQGSITDLARAWERAAGPRRALLVADGNTLRAAGKRAAQLLEEAGTEVRLHVLNDGVAPDRAIGEAIVGNAKEDECILAVGSGVINDLAKYAASRLERRYVCVATAASMDGYTSAGAPLSDRGFKITIPCRPPAAVVGDLEILAQAPGYLTSRGFGDLAGKVPAGADWIVADLLGIEAIDAECFRMAQDHIASPLAEPEAIAAGDSDAVARLFDGLLLAGFAMGIHGSSRPASGADHQIAHLWEMMNLGHNGERVGHGSCVAVGCVAVIRIYEWLLARNLADLDAEEILGRAPDMGAKRSEIREHFVERAVVERAEAETRAKHLDAAAHRERLGTIAGRWPELRRRLARHLVPSRRMQKTLTLAGAPATPADIGIDAARMRKSVRAARFLRRRYTVLDLLEDTGLLEDALSEVFA